ncbi:hypothetical protein ACFSM7_11825 [Clavibacter michiganensis subsp. tessellarius]
MLCLLASSLVVPWCSARGRRHQQIRFRTVGRPVVRGRRRASCPPRDG